MHSTVVCCTGVSYPVVEARFYGRHKRILTKAQHSKCHKTRQLYILNGERSITPAGLSPRCNSTRSSPDASALEAQETSTGKRVGLRYGEGGGHVKKKPQQQRQNFAGSEGPTRSPLHYYSTSNSTVNSRNSRKGIKPREANSSERKHMWWGRRAAQRRHNNKNIFQNKIFVLSWRYILAVNVKLFIYIRRLQTRQKPLFTIIFIILLLYLYIRVNLFRFDFSGYCSVILHTKYLFQVVIQVSRRPQIVTGVALHVDVGDLARGRIRVIQRSQVDERVLALHAPKRHFHQRRTI